MADLQALIADPDFQALPLEKKDLVLLAFKDRQASPSMDAVQAEPSPAFSPLLGSQTLGDVAGFFGEGANRGMTGALDLVNTPLNWATSGINRVAGTNIPPLSASGYAASKGYILPDEAATTLPARVSRKAGEYAGQALAQGGILGTASATAPIEGILGRALTAPYAASMGKALASDVGIGAGAGIGAYTGREFGGSLGYPNAGEFAGGLLGGVATGLGAQGAGTAWDRWGPGSTARQLATQEAMDQARAAKTFTQAASNPSSLDRLDQLATTGDPAAARVPGVQRTVPEILNDTGLRTVQRDMAANDPTFLGQLEARKAGNLGRLDDALETLAPTGPSPLVTQKAVSQTLEAQRAQIADTLTEARDAAQQEIARLGPNVSRADKAQVIDDAMNAAEDSFRQSARTLYKSAEEAGAFPPSMQGVKDALKEAQTAAGKAQRKRIPANLSKTIEGYGANESIDELFSLDREVNQVLRDARRSGDKPTQLLVGKVKTGIEATLDGLQESGNGKAADLLRKAKDYFKAGAQVFNEGITSRVTSDASNATPGTATASRFFKPGAGGASGAREAAQEFNTTLDHMAATGSDVTAPRQAIRDYAIQSAAAASTDQNGIWNAKRLGAWLAKHEDALGEFPDVRDQLSTVRKAQAAAEAAGVTANESLAQMERGAAAAYVKSTPEEAVQTILTAQDPRSALSEVAGAAAHDQDAIRGLRRSVYDWVRRAGEGGKLVADETGLRTEPGFSYERALKKFSDPKYQRGLRVLMGDEHMRHVREILETGATSEASNLPTATRPRFREEVANVNGTGAAGDKAMQVIGWVLSHTPGIRGKAGGIGTAISSAYGGQQMADYAKRFPTERVLNLVEEAVSNPVAARLLNAKATAPNLKKVNQLLEATKRSAAVTGAIAAQGGQ